LLRNGKIANAMHFIPDFQVANHNNYYRYNNNYWFVKPISKIQYIRYTIYNKYTKNIYATIKSEF